MRDRFRHRYLQDRLDLGRQRPDTLATDNEAEKLCLTTHELALRPFSQELMLPQRLQNGFDVAKMDPKKDGKLRMCIDYRLLNAQTVHNRFPTPTASDLIARTRGAQWFSKVDLHSGFHQLRIREEDVHKTAFATPSGLFEFVTAPFGLTNVPGAFQRFMQHVLAEHIEAGYCVVYCDDVAIFSTDPDPLRKQDRRRVRRGAHNTSIQEHLDLAIEGDS